MTTIEKIKSIDAQDKDIGLKFGHYRHLAELINRWGFKDVVEVGCAYGNLAEYLLEYTQIETLTSVDPYLAYNQMPGLSTQEDYDTLYDYVHTKLRQDGEDLRFMLIRDTSKSFFNRTWAKGVFKPDFVFLDGDHSYETVSWEIEHYSKLLKKDTILAGHDITVFEGVDRAVNEYAEKTGKEIYRLPANIWYFIM